MALIKCTECGHKVSDRASVCPNCGYPIDNSNYINKSTTDKMFRTNVGKSYVWTVIVAIILVMLISGGYFAYTTLSDKGEKNVSAGEGVSDVVNGAEKEDEFDVKGFIIEYYDAVDDGSYASYFEDDDITFFRLEHVSKDAVIEAINSSPKRNTSREYDWATLETTALPSGTIKAVYSSDFYIHYESRTDKYRITTEMVISPNGKIQSLKDLETVKESSIKNSNRPATIGDNNYAGNSSNRSTVNAPSWIQGTWTYDVNSPVGVIASYKIEISGNTMSFFRNGKPQWSETFSYENGQLVGNSHKLRVNENYHRIIDESGNKYNGNGTSSSSFQFHTAHDVIGYLSGKVYHNNGSSLQVRQDGIYSDGRCITAAPVVLNFSSYSATIRANTIYAQGMITLYIDSKNGTIRDGMGDLWH